MKNIQNLFCILIIIVIVSSLIGFSTGTINIIVDIFTKYILTGAITSFIAGTIVEKFTGDTLKTYFLNIEVKGVHLSCSVFLITVIVLKLIVFR